MCAKSAVAARGVSRADRIPRGYNYDELASPTYYISLVRVYTWGDASTLVKGGWKFNVSARAKVFFFFLHTPMCVCKRVEVPERRECVRALLCYRESPGRVCLIQERLIATVQLI